MKKSEDDSLGPAGDAIVAFVGLIEALREEHAGFMAPPGEPVTETAWWPVGQAPRTYIHGLSIGTAAAANAADQAFTGQDPPGFEPGEWYICAGMVALGQEGGRMKAKGPANWT